MFHLSYLVIYTMIIILLGPCCYVMARENCYTTYHTYCNNIISKRYDLYYTEMDHKLVIYLFKV